jgi:endonuclease YncB( thermonuclease family)
MFRRFARQFALLCLPVLALGSPAVDRPGAADEPVSYVLRGKVSRVSDGDTIRVVLASGPSSVRLASVDAPERDQPGGREATAALASRLKGRDVGLEVVEQRDGFGRLVAVVWLDDENINEWLVREGRAWAFRDFLHDARFCAIEREAREARAGLWAREERNYAPWEWRRVRPGQQDRLKDYERETLEQCAGRAQEGLVQPVAPQPFREEGREPGSCKIKGNISRSGRIYHLPGTAAYDRTDIDEARGERWFCSEAQARDAGWRAPRN